MKKIILSSLIVISLLQNLSAMENNENFLNDALFPHEMATTKNMDLESYLNHENRPLSVQNKIDDVFNKLKINTKPKDCWNYDGSDFYEILGVNDHAIIKKIIKESPSPQTDFYFIDIGAGNFSWGNNLVKFINTTDFSKDIRVHIIGVTGENTGEPEVSIQEKCTIYKFSAFKIEDLSNVFKQKIPTLEGKVDLIVSKWTFRHLVDPVGTFIQAYNMLRPITGLLMMDGFFFSDSDEYFDLGKVNMDDDFRKLLEELGVPFVISPYFVNRSLNHFSLKKPDNQPCKLPMNYNTLNALSQNIEQGYNISIGSNCATHFTWTKPIASPVWTWHETLKPHKNMPKRLILSGDPTLITWFQEIFISQD